MNNLFQYLCQSCGSQLITNDERKIMICKSCGNVYDYDYFREDKLIEMADLSREKGEFVAATKMYKFMLDKEPSNFKALNGLLLCESRISNLKDIPPLLQKNNFTPRVKDLSFYKENCNPNDLAYFEKVESIMSRSRKYIDLGTKITDQSRNIKFIYSQIERNENKAREYYIREKHGSYSHPKKALILTIIGYLIIVGFIALIGIQSEFSDDSHITSVVIGCLIFFTIVFAFPIGFDLNQLKRYNETLEPNVKLNQDVDAEIEKKHQIESEREETLKKIRNHIVEAKKLIPKDN